MRYVLVKEPSKYQRTFHEVEEVLERMPYTWSPYLKAPQGLVGIVNMEMGEVKRALEAGDHAWIVKEMTHLAAACVHAVNK